jgi:pimeloyl-ACP methyl ester carboxylesterase
VETQLLEVAGTCLEVARTAAARPGLPTAVWLHEGLGCLALWRDFPARLAAATGAAAVVYSRRGYGRSAPRTVPYGADYLHAEALEVLPALLAATGVERPLLVGHSDGASIALIAAGSGVACSGVVAMAPHVSVEAKAVAAIAEVGRSAASSGLLARLARFHDTPEQVFRGWHDTWLSPAFRTWSIEALLPAITAPIVAIQGEDDEYATSEQVEAIARAARAPCEVVLLPGCRHSPHRDRSEQTAALIARFIIEGARPNKESTSSSWHRRGRAAGSHRR